MKTKYLIFSYMLFLCFACNQRSGHYNKKISRSKMVQVLADMHICDAIAENNSKGKREIAYIKAKLYSDKIFSIHNISKKDFDETYEYYIHHPREMDELNDQVIQEITKRESKLK